MSPRRWIRLGMAALFALSFVLGAPAAQEATPTQVKAAYLINFLRYTQWPDASAQPRQERRILVLGSRDFSNTLRGLLAQPGNQPTRVVVVRLVPGVPRTVLRQELGLAHVVFVETEAWPDTTAVLAELSGRPVLTVGDAPRFARQGGMLGLVQQGSRIVFDANPVAIRGSGLQVSAKVLKLARIVEPESSS